MPLKHVVQAVFLLLVASVVGGSATRAKEPKALQVKTAVQVPVLKPVVVKVHKPAVEPVSVPSTTTLRMAGIQLARQGVNEAGFEHPFRDMEGILQVGRNIQRDQDSLLAVLQRLSPRVAGIVPASDPRQLWTGTLPATGKDPGKGWIECPAHGCTGTWRLYTSRWDEIRQYGIELVRMTDPPTPVQGVPLTWGGEMDLYRASIERPNLCMLESGDTSNYFFGVKTNPKNKCIPIPAELLAKSKDTHLSRTVAVPASLAKGGAI